jgi:hypothetical protein
MIRNVSQNTNRLNCLQQMTTEGQHRLFGAFRQLTNLRTTISTQDQTS